jgi:hypothetical protein
MANDSSTGGYLVPSSTGGDLNDLALAIFLQQIVVGICGLPGNMVRPRWQPEPPNIPDFGTNWAAIGPGTRKRDPFSATIHDPSGDGSSTVVRNRTMEILCSFYGPQAETNSELLAMGLEVSQNRELMQLQGFNIVSGAGDSIIVPILIKQRWQYRVDLPFTVRQQQKYTYPILNLEGAEATFTVDDAGQTLTESLSVSIADSGYGNNGYGQNTYGK